MKQMIFGWMEESLQFSNVPAALWSDAPIDVVPGQPEAWAWIDKLADEVEIKRLVEMGVLQERCNYHGEINGSLTTRFVYDWRLKTFEDGSSENGIPIKKWMNEKKSICST